MTGEGGRKAVFHIFGSEICTRSGDLVANICSDSSDCPYVVLLNGQRAFMELAEPPDKNTDEGWWKYLLKACRQIGRAHV